MSFESLLTMSMRVFKGRIPDDVDSQGEERVAWVYQLTAPCVIKIATQYAFVKLGIQSQVTHVIFCEYLDAMAAEPTARWRLDVEEYPGTFRTYVLVEPKDPMGRQHHLELGVRRLDEKVHQLILPSGLASAEVFGVVTA